MTLLISPESTMVADVVARSYTNAVEALERYHDIVFLDAAMERCYDILRKVRYGLRLPGQIVVFGHDERAVAQLRAAVRQLYSGPGTSGGTTL